MIKYKIQQGNTIIEFPSLELAQAYKSLNSITEDILEIEEVMSQSDQMTTLETLSEKYILYGSQLYQTLKRKIWAVNTYNKSLGHELTIAEMTALLQTSDILQKALESGSLLTAISILQQLKVSLPSYSSVADFALADIAAFLV